MAAPKPPSFTDWLNRSLLGQHVNTDLEAPYVESQAQNRLVLVLGIAGVLDLIGYILISQVAGTNQPWTDWTGAPWQPNLLLRLPGAAWLIILVIVNLLFAVLFYLYVLEKTRRLFHLKATLVRNDFRIIDYRLAIKSFMPIVAGSRPEGSSTLTLTALETHGEQQRQLLHLEGEQARKAIHDVMWGDTKDYTPEHPAAPFSGDQAALTAPLDDYAEYPSLRFKEQAFYSYLCPVDAKGFTHILLVFDKPVAKELDLSGEVQDPPWGIYVWTRGDRCSIAKAGITQNVQWVIKGEETKTIVSDIPVYYIVMGSGTLRQYQKDLTIQRARPPTKDDIAVVKHNVTVHQAIEIANKLEAEQTMRKTAEWQNARLIIVWALQLNRAVRMDRQLRDQGRKSMMQLPSGGILSDLSAWITAHKRGLLFALIVLGAVVAVGWLLASGALTAFMHAITGGGGTTGGGSLIPTEPA